jgi:CheY-like chemotaxis protein
VDVVHSSVVRLVRADRSQIEQVVLNLVVNARDAMPRGGPIRIVHEGVDPTDDCTERRVRLSVVDVGIGMTAETRARVFEPFFTSKENGTGLGMATVLSIVEQCGGSIQVHSELGLGTTVTIHLREVSALDDQCADDQAPGPLPPRIGPPARVLVVDDCHEIVDIVRLILVPRGYEVHAAASAEEALEIVRAGQLPSLVLTDVVLPGRSGRELVDAIEREFEKVPALYISGYAADEALRRRLESGEGTFLEKPFTAPELIFAVERALAGSLGERGA